MSCWPPSMSKVAPVTAEFVMRWTASAAMSVGPTTRRIGSVRPSSARRLSRSLPRVEAESGVATRPAGSRVARDGGESGGGFLRHGGPRGGGGGDRAGPGRRGPPAGSADEEQRAAGADFADADPGDLQPQKKMRFDVVARLFEVEVRE